MLFPFLALSTLLLCAFVSDWSTNATADEHGAKNIHVQHRRPRHRTPDNSGFAENSESSADFHHHDVQQEQPMTEWVHENDPPLQTDAENHQNPLSSTPKNDGIQNVPYYNDTDLFKNCTNDTTIIAVLLNETVYNKHKLPNPDGVDVKVEFWIQEISSVSEMTNDFEMDMYINEMWIDESLRYVEMEPCKENVSLSYDVFDKIWTPNSCFVNSKYADIHNSPFKNIFLMIYPNGTVWANYRVKVKGPCNMDLSKFPMDRQECHLTYQSFSYNKDEVHMQWADNRADPVWGIKNFTLPDFELTGMHNSSREASHPAGQWDELHAKFSFERRYMWYVLQAYIPTYLTIFISWISFTLGSKAIPARTMLGVNSLLAMIMMFGNIMKNLPRVSYVKAIDVWMLACMTFNFCSLLELAIVGYITKDPAPCSKTSQSGDAGLTPTANVSVGVTAVFGSSASMMTGKKLCKHYHPQQCQNANYYSNHHRQKHERNLSRYIFGERKTTNWYQNCKNILCPPVWTADRIDKFSCFAFPALFSLFNIAYWGYYMHK